MKVQESFLYNYDDGKIMGLPVEPLFVRCSASGAKAHKSGQLKAKLRFREEFVNRVMSKMHARLVWSRHLAVGTNVKANSTLEEQDVSTRPASPNINAAIANAAGPVRCSPFSTAKLDDEENWTISDSVEVDSEVRAGVKRHVCDLLESCRAKRRKVL